MQNEVASKDSSTDLFAVSLLLLLLYIHCLRLVSHTCWQNWRPSPAKPRTTTKINTSRLALNQHAQRLAIDYAQSTSCSDRHVHFGSRRLRVILDKIKSRDVVISEYGRRGQLTEVLLGPQFTRRLINEAPTRLASAAVFASYV